MNGRMFSRITSAWTPELLEAVYAMRYHRMVHGTGNICVPNTEYVSTHAPFTKANYQWQHKIPSLNTPEWSHLRAMRPQDVLCGNPFAPSLTRPGKYRVWDGAVAVAACALRHRTAIKFNEVPAVRNCNNDWLNRMEPAIRRIGPIGFEGEVLRPVAPFLFDLTTNKFGWKILEAAHVLGHYRGDVRAHFFEKEWAPNTGPTAGDFIGALGEIVFSLMFDIPMDVSQRENNDPGEPDFQHGIEVKTSTTFLEPVLKLPWNNRETPQPDRTLAVCQMTAYVEPHPRCYENQTEWLLPNDHWCCVPTIIGFAGWECMDVIAHQPLGQAHLFNGAMNHKAPLQYVMRGNDLMEPSLFWAYLKTGHETLGPMVTDQRWQYFHDWVETPQYKELQRSVSGLVCADCLSFVKSDKAPRFPRPGVKKEDHDYKEQQQRAEDVRRVAKLVNTAVLTHEGRQVYGSVSEAVKTRRARKAAHAASLTQQIKEATYMRLHTKHLQQGRVLPGKQNPVNQLTPKQSMDYARYRSELGEERAHELEQLVLKKLTT